MFQEISGQYKNFIHKAPLDFELIINLISSKLWSGLPDAQQLLSPEETGVNIGFLAAGDLYPSMQYLSQILKQAIIEVVPKVC